MKHDDFRKGGMVSVWIGNFNSELELDAYMNMDRDFEKDFDFKLNERDMPEATVGDLPLTIEELVDGFSCADSYKSAVTAIAKQRRIERATTMVMFLNFEFVPSRVNVNLSAPLQFLGAVPFHK